MIKLYISRAVYQYGKLIKLVLTSQSNPYKMTLSIKKIDLKGLLIDYGNGKTIKL